MVLILLSLKSVGAGTGSKALNGNQITLNVWESHWWDRHITGRADTSRDHGFSETSGRGPSFFWTSCHSLKASPHLQFSLESNTIKWFKWCVLILAAWKWSLNFFSPTDYWSFWLTRLVHEMCLLLSTRVDVWKNWKPQNQDVSGWKCSLLWQSQFFPLKTNKIIFASKFLSPAPIFCPDLD